MSFIQNEPDHEELTKFRAELRRQLIAKREAMPPAVRAAASAAIGGHLSGLLGRLAPTTLAFCWPYRGEFDARPLAERLSERGVTLALPVVLGKSQPMVFREWSPEAPMVADRFGIPVPARGSHVHPDAILMPLNGFDGQGYRLGYGGGYFDRTLESLAPPPIAIGVGFELSRVDSIHPQAFDARLDYVVTELGISHATESGLVLRGEP